MKKLHVSSVSILFAALCLAFTACNQGVTAGNGTGTVRVVIGGETARAVDAAGMPVFDETNTKITVTGEDGTKLAEGTTSVTVEVGIGTKITVKAVVTTAAGVWRGSTEHTVTEGDNPVSVKLSKAPNSVGNILIDVVEQNPKYGQVKFKLAGGKELVSKALISNQEYLVTARDSIGRIYVLYREGSFGSATFHFKRYDTEGKENNGFEAAITGKLPSGVTLNTIKTMTVDAKTNTVFVVVADGSTNLYAYAVTETTHNTFTWSGAFNLTSLPPITSLHGIEAMAAYNNRLFLVVDVVDTTGNRHNKLFAYKVVLSATAFSLEQEGSGIELNKLRSYTGCTGLFADADGVYCLLSDQNLYGGNLYALGQIVRYQYSGSAFTGETKIGLNPKAAGTDGIPFDAQYFSAPVGFIGYDEENLYIADDGVGIQYVNENYHVTANKNRIAAFNRKTNEITFTDTNATWYGQKPEYKYPNTKILLWEREPSGAFRYWTSADGTEAFTDANKLFDASSYERPTDIFCYDQDGNLYILWTDGSGYKVRRFELKNDGSYDRTREIDSYAIGHGPRTPQYIAVDISAGQNCLYYGSKNGDWRVSKLMWNTNFTSLNGAGTEVIDSIPGEMTALAANKDGVFVATKAQTGLNNPPYTLKINKYKKNGSPDGEKTIANNEGGGYNPSSAYTKDDGTIYGLQVIDGELYALRHNIKEKIIYVMSNHRSDEFRSSGVIYKVGNTDGSLSDTAMSELGKKEADDASRTGYGFYRFIAVKPKKLVIASDGAWGMEGTNISSQKYQNTDKVLEYDLAEQLQSENNAGGSFSKQLTHGTCDFEWK